MTAADNAELPLRHDGVIPALAVDHKHGMYTADTQ